MLLRADVQIQAMIKTMTDVILPALDPDNQMAQEQSQLLLGTLMSMNARLPYQFAFDCDELRRLVGFADALAAEASGDAPTTDAVTRLASEAMSARDVLDRAKAGPAEVVEAVRRLRSSSCALIDAVYADDAAAGCRDAVTRTVMDMSRDQIVRDRVWALPQGFEPDPASLPALDSLLGTA